MFGVVDVYLLRFCRLCFGLLIGLYLFYLVVFNLGDLWVFELLIIKVAFF